MKAGERTLDTAKRKSAAPGVAERLGLLVFFGDGVHTFPLPESGDAVVGRSREADIHVADDSLSRKHAALKVSDGKVTVKDLGSQNGTKVNQSPVGKEWVPLQIGDALQLGDATAVLQRNGLGRQHRRLWTHLYFEARLEEECARGMGQFAVVRVHVEGSAKDAAVAEAVSRVMHIGDCLASYAPGELEALLVNVSETQAQERADALVAALEPLGVAARTGMAWYPKDGREAERLLARACADVTVVERPTGKGSAGGPVIVSAAMKRLYEMVERVAASDISTLVLGETGSGKELVARAIHQQSSRAKGPFVALNCGALAESLLESELFGHEKGSFTGASDAHTGLLESAGGGSVFLDEIGELPQTLQAKLLRVLEEKAVRKVGGAKAKSIDVRFIAATNRDLEAEVKAKRFREDLYYRVAAVTLSVPPLRERKDEIEPLARAFIAESGRRASLSETALAPLMDYAWPGNIRELRNVIERAVLLADGGLIEAHHLPLEKLSALWLDATPHALPDQPPPPKGGHTAERQRIIAALSACAGNQTQAAKRLGISRRTLLYRLDAYGLPRPQKKASE